MPPFSDKRTNNLSWRKGWLNCMELIVYPLLSRYAKKRIIRKKWRWGKTYNYKPDIRTIRRLKEKLGLSEDAIRKQINDERKFLLQYPQYY